MDELLEAFLAEAGELAQRAAADLLALEERPGDAALIAGAFRAVHTLKGGVALFDLAPMGALLHAAEDVLGALREGRAADRPTMAALIAAIGQAERWVAQFLSAQAAVLPVDAAPVAAAIVARLRATAGEPAIAQAATPPPDESWAASLAQALAPEAGGALVAVRYTPHPGSYFRGEDPLAVAAGVPALCGGRVSAPAADAAYDPFRCGLVFELVSTAPLAAVQAAFRLVAPAERMIAVVPAAPVPAVAAPAGAARTLRVDAARIDALLRLVDELQAAHAALDALAAAPDTGREKLRAGIAAAGGVIARLHRDVMATRLLPLDALFRRLPLAFRDMAEGLGKTATLAVTGSAIEADKDIVDGLFEPLLHLLRNAVDHGIEPAEERRAAGKPAVATVTLHAARDGGRLLVSLSDDGRGIDPAVLRATAVRRGLLGEATAAALDDAAALDLVFAPGFSTAARIGALSGRGVGMDAVRSAVARLGGRVGLTARPGAGTQVTLSLPATLVMTELLLVRAGGDGFGVPVAAVAGVTRVPPGGRLPVRHGQAFLWQGMPVPLLALAALLALPADPTPDGLVVVFAAADGALLGIEVASVDGRLMAVLRPPGGLLAGLPGLAGTVLAGDGQVLAVLDLADLVRHAMACEGRAA